MENMFRCLLLVGVGIGILSFLSGNAEPEPEPEFNSNYSYVLDKKSQNTIGMVNIPPRKTIASFEIHERKKKEVIYSIDFGPTIDWLFDLVGWYKDVPKGTIAIDLDDEYFYFVKPFKISAFLKNDVAYEIYSKEYMDGTQPIFAVTLFGDFVKLSLQTKIDIVDLDAKFIQLLNCRYEGFHAKKK